MYFMQRELTLFVESIWRKKNIDLDFVSSLKIAVYCSDLISPELKTRMSFWNQD